VSHVNRMVDGLGRFQQHLRLHTVGIPRRPGCADVGTIAGQVDQPRPAWHVDRVHELIKASGPPGRNSQFKSPARSCRSRSLTPDRVQCSCCIAVVASCASSVAACRSAAESKVTPGTEKSWTPESLTTKS
jgi:hypothetical protein